MTVEPGLVGRAAALAPAFVALLRSLVEEESPSGDEEALEAVASLVAREAEARGGTPERRRAPGAGSHLRVTFPGSRGGRLLVLGHLDTVHPRGTLERLPFVEESGVIRGPGAYDMKGNVAAALLALDLLRREGGSPGRELVFLLTCDEEVGSPTSRALIEGEARGADATLVIEPPLPGGGVKLARKGVAVLRLRVEGRAAHAGIEPERGASAVHELARQIGRVVELADPATGTTVNVGTARGGTATNVVAAEAEAGVDVRFWSRAEGERVVRAVRSLSPVDPRCRLEVEGGVNRPPLEPTPESLALYRAAREVGGRLGIRLPEGRSGGGSDGNFTAGVGCPTLDGLGIDGGGAHSLDEHIRIDDVPRRIALLAALFQEL